MLYASTPAVRELAGRVCAILGCDQAGLGLVDVSVRVRDVGMVGLPDAVLLGTSTMAPEEWEVLARHPVVGAELVGSFSDLVSVAAVVRSHHERWDGDGYPDGLRGQAIPLLSRVIAACDAYVAIAQDRPHRRGLGAELALERVCAESARQFDPRVTDALFEAVSGAGAQKNAPSIGSTRQPPAPARLRSARATPPGAQGVGATITDLSALPAFAPACERVLALTAEGDDSRSDLVAAIESDLGLTVAVLREAQRSGARTIANVPDAVTALHQDKIRTLVTELPRAAFPWRTRWEMTLQQARIHAQGVARATQRLAQELDRDDRDLLLTVALLHDVGKLVLALAYRDYDGNGATGSRTPEERLRLERKQLTVDHASVGGLLLERWGLAAPLVAAVRGHHAAANANGPAGIVRLADSVAHYAQGDPVDKRVIVGLAARAGLDIGALRRVLFELPHGGGSQRRRATPSTLTSKETLILRRLAQGKVYKQIAAEIGLSASTVRSHLSHIYVKLGVDDRAQAVLRATELAWI